MIDLYERIVLRRARLAVAALLALVAGFAFFIKDFRLDASADSLVLEQDEDVRYYRLVSQRYAGGDFVIVTFSPEGDLFSPESLGQLRRLRAQLRSLPRVSSVVSVLDVPLLKNPPVPLKEFIDNIKTLDSGKADLELAVAEFADSPIYSSLLVSPDLTATAIQVNFKSDPANAAMLDRRSELLEKKLNGELSSEEEKELAGVVAAYRAYKDSRRQERRQDIARIREIIDGHRATAKLFLGGVPMIVDDIISFIRKDLRVFGLGMLCFLVITLWFIFRRKRWVSLPMLSCAFSVVIMTGLLGLSAWDVTVVSSNFISLQLIFTMSLAIHITVRYRELSRENPQQENPWLVRETVRATFVPCFYASLTTIAGFSSLVVCDILPVVNFGWMMTMGILVSLSLTFLFFPAALMILPRPPADREKDFGVPLTTFFGRLTERRGPAIFVSSLALAAVTIWGIFRVEVENSFIDYFKESTEIYRGMEFIDRKLGGTTPLEVMIEFPEAEAPEAEPSDDDDSFDEFEEFEEDGEEAADPATYWFTRTKLELIERVHDYLDAQPATGKVLSLATLWKVTRQLNEGKAFDDFATAILFNQMPGKFRDILVDPYVSIENNQVRIATRIKDSMPSLRRDVLIKNIRRDLVDKVGLKEGQFRLTGLMVLYNNMLQSLFRSQIKTIGFTVLALFVMFMLLFRSLKIALIAIFPNLLSAMTVLGVMGLGSIPLDVMTITIVAISVGIAVDDTIHYLHRFEREFEKDGDYIKTMYRCHGSIGNAMYYTSLAITIGFSILSLSNFIPTILFGLLTALAMVMALVASLTLLPRMIIFFKPFGPDRQMVKS